MNLRQERYFNFIVDGIIITVKKLYGYKFISIEDLLNHRPESGLFSELTHADTKNPFVVYRYKNKGKNDLNFTEYCFSDKYTLLYKMERDTLEIEVYNTTFMDFIVRTATEYFLRDYKIICKFGHKSILLNYDIINIPKTELKTAAAIAASLLKS